jgi:DNA-directed RNA polymerase beta' subunit
MKSYIYQNTLIDKKKLRQLLAWSFTSYDSMQACLLADELKYLGFKYASYAGISISIEDLKIPFVKSVMLEKANQEIHNSEKIFLKGKITDVERFQKIIDTWNLTSESLKNQIIYYFKNYDPLNSVYIMAFSGARGNLSQVRQLVGMRGLMSDPSGQIMNLPIKNNFREGLTITDYLMSGYGARKGIVDTSLKTANSGYLTRRLIDVSQDILIREKDCFTNQSFIFSVKDFKNTTDIYNKILGRVLNKPVYEPKTLTLLAKKNTQITRELIKKFEDNKITNYSIRSPLTCNLYRAICQKCYGWDLTNENLVDIGEAVGILAGQSIGEPGTQLTMRTFHTGGIFTSEARQQIISPINGIIKFYKQLKTVTLRTNRGEDVLVTKNSGSLILIPLNKQKELVKIDISRNTILFPKNNQYLSKDAVIGELINTNKQIKTEVKTVLSDTCGEIFIPKLKQRINSLTNNKLIWILSGQLYNSPINSFVNFYSDYKLNKFSYIFRTKLINHYSGLVMFTNNKKSLHQRRIKINNRKYLLKNSKLEKLNSSVNCKNYLLTLDQKKYCITLTKQYSINYLQLTRNEKVGTLVNNSFLTLTGGIIYYDFRNSLKTNNKTKQICLQLPLSVYSYRIEMRVLQYEQSSASYVCVVISKRTIANVKRKIKNLVASIDNLKNKKNSNQKINYELNRLRREKRKTHRKLLKSQHILSNAQNRLHKLSRLIPKFETFVNQYKSNFDSFRNSQRGILKHRTIVWLGTEIHKTMCEETNLFVEDGDFIGNEFELIPNLFSKTSGIVNLSSKNNNTQMISIKSGLVYQGKHLKQLEKKVFYPGELSSNAGIKTLALSEYINGENYERLLIRPMQIYEFPHLAPTSLSLRQNINSQLSFTFEPTTAYLYKPNQQIHGMQSVNLVTNLLLFKTNNSFEKNIKVNLSTNKYKNLINFNITETINPDKYVSPYLRDKNIDSCLLIQKDQFVSNYSVLGYLETLTLDSLEIVKFKTKKQNGKHLFLISNNDCIIVKKSEVRNKKLNDFIVSKFNLSKTGKIIIENDNFFTVQKGRPYFFPNCKSENVARKTNLEYKVLPRSFNNGNFDSNQNIFVNYYDLQKLLIKQHLNSTNLENEKVTLKSQFSKLFLKNKGKFYSCLIPRFSKRFSITNNNLTSKLKTLLCPNNIKTKSFNKIQFDRTLLLQSSELISNNNRRVNSDHLKYQLVSIKFTEHPFTRSTKAIGLYSITEDYFEKDMNSVFCRNNEFIESGKTLGLLNLEKEITGDIVQGLPRIEEILEARKKNSMKKRIPTSQKKSLLSQKTSLDVNFEFHKIGTSIKENEKINPHKLIKVYFNYYGLLKFFLCDRTNTFKYARLTSNYEASQKSFKKVQLFILHSVQSVYKSQGVTINDKHLEIIIKQMTTKVLITYEGNTPLLQREVIDLYHIQYINKILLKEKKRIAHYVPLLLGITKAALNNPSFISAASFQETTRVLTKAAIEGRIDWLRGLKENIVIGHLIPAGTGSLNYKNSFRKYLSKKKFKKFNSVELLQKPRQIN